MEQNNSLLLNSEDDVKVLDGEANNQSNNIIKTQQEPSSEQIQAIAEIKNYYLKQDTDAGYIEDDTQIEFEKIKNFKDTCYNFMLGEFDEVGEYKLSDEIAQELIDMPKKIDYIDNLGIHARGFLGDRVFYFMVTQPVAEENGNAYCFLQFDEDMERMGGCYIDTHTVIVATYEYKFDNNYETLVRQVFNLKEYESDDTGEEGRRYFADNISKMFELHAKLQEEYDETFEKLEEIYFSHRIQLLSKNPDTALIMAEFMTKRTKLEPFIKISQRKYYTLNQILDDVLQTNKSQACLAQAEVKEQLGLVEQKYIQKSKIIVEKMNQQKQQSKEAKQNTFQFSDSGKKSEKPVSKPAPKGLTKGDGGKSSKGKSGKPKSKGGKSAGKGKGGAGKPKGRAVGGNGAPQKRTQNANSNQPRNKDNTQKAKEEQTSQTKEDAVVMRF